MTTVTAPGLSGYEVFISQLNDFGNITKQCKRALATNEKDLRVANEILDDLFQSIQNTTEKIKYARKDYLDQQIALTEGKRAFKEGDFHIDLNCIRVTQETFEMKYRRATEYVTLLEDQANLWQMRVKIKELTERKAESIEKWKDQQEKIALLEKEAMAAGDGFVQANLKWIIEHAPEAADYIRTVCPDPKLAELEATLEKKEDTMWWMYDRLVLVNEGFLKAEVVYQKKMLGYEEDKKEERKKRKFYEMDDIEDLDIVDGQVVEVKARKIARTSRAASVDF